ncbi:MAG TPA: phosphoribosylanthranilate isomerase [Clostridia bacterium]
MSAPMVKICGLVRLEDADRISALRPEFAGVVFASGRRQRTPAESAALMTRLDGSIRKVGVFSDTPFDILLYAVAVCRLDVVQLHGNESPEDIVRLRQELHRLGKENVRIWKMIGVMAGNRAVETAVEVFTQASAYAGTADAILLDARIPVAGPALQQRGGNGCKFDWHIARAVVAHLSMPVILAGGLDPENVSEAVSLVRPYAVDVSSGVETDGYKDGEKVRRFIGNARKAGMRQEPADAGKKRGSI